MAKRSLTILIDSPKTVYFQGESVSGRVILETSEELKVRGIGLHFHGFGHVHWTERHSNGKNTRTVHYSSRETYADQRIILLDKVPGSSDNIILAPNTYTYPFTIQIPQGAPSSYEAHIGRVRYVLVANVDRPWAFDVTTRHTITVMRPLDLNLKPELVNGSETTDQKTLCCLCCKSDPIIAHIKIDRQGYVPGEAVPFTAEIENKSNREMSCSKAQLIMAVTYHATRKSRTVRNIINEMRHGQIEGGGADTWFGEKLHIPAVPPSYLEGCRIIDIRYFIAILVDPSGPAFDLCVPLEIVIGSIPLAPIAQQYGLILPSAPPSNSLPPGAPGGLYNDAVMPTNLPQATFAESAMGRVSTKEEADNEDTTGNTDFAPVYTYYDWNKQDPATAFTVQMNEQ